MIKRVTIGFLSIVLLLFFAGMISLFELGHLSNDAEKLMNESRRSMESAKDMLEALNHHNAAVSHIILTGHNVRYDTLCRASMEHIEFTLGEVAERTKNNAAVDSLKISVAQFRALTDDFLASATDTSIFSDNQSGSEFLTKYLEPEMGQYKDIFWYDVQYEGQYNKIVEQINDYMVLTFNGLTPQTEMLSRNAYRAVTPVLISLLVMIAIVLMLYYFIMIYCVRPIVGMNKSLKNYLSFRQSFNVKEQCRDELQGLRDNIDSLIQIYEKLRNR